MILLPQALQMLEQQACTMPGLKAHFLRKSKAAQMTQLNN